MVEAVEPVVPRHLRTLLAIAVATVAAVGVLWALPLGAGFGGALIGASTGAFVTSVVGLAILSLVRVPLGLLRAPPGTGLAYLAHRLRFAGLPVAQEPKGLRVRIGPLLVLRFDAVPTAEGCRVCYRWEPNPVGWTGYLLVWGLVFLLPFGIPMVLIALRVWRFDARVLTPIVPADGVVPPLPEVEAVKAALVDGLSECHRLAEEAYEAERTRYWDWQGIAALVGFLAGGMALLVSLFVSPGPDPVQRFLGAVPFAVAGGIATGTALGILVRWKLRPAVLRYREWARRLRPVLDREISGAAPRDAEGSSFEALMAAAREVPDWIEARRRAGLSADLGMWSLFFIVLGWAVQLQFTGAYLLASSSLFGVSAIVGSLPFVVALYFWWRWWDRRQREAAEHQGAAWNARFDAIRAQLESYLQDL